MRRFEITLPTLHTGQIAIWALKVDHRATIPDFIDENGTPGSAWLENSGGRFRAGQCGRRFGKCLARGSRIAMADGTHREVQDVQSGEMVWTLNETTWKIEAKSVRAVIPNGMKGVVEVRTNMRRLVVTPNHPILAHGGWTEAANLHPGQLIASPKALESTARKEAPDAEIDFLAVWLAEGSDTKISNTTAQILKAVERAVAYWDCVLRPTKKPADWSIHHEAPRPRHWYGNWRSPVTNWLKYHRLWGKNSKTKFIPEWVYQLPDHQLARFLNLFVACDGCVTRKSPGTWALEIGLANEHMVRQLSELFLRFGIRGQIRYKKHNKLNRHGQPFESWTYMVSEAQSFLKFCDQIGALAKEPQIAKARAAADRGRGTCNTYVPFSYQDLDGAIWDFPTRPSALQAILRAWRKQDPSRITNMRFNQLRPHLAGLDVDLGPVDGDVAWEEIMSVTPAGEAETWDLSLADNHNFIAEGIVTHNTSEAVVEACETAAAGKLVGWFAPDFKTLSEAYLEIADLLAPMKGSSNKDKYFRTRTGGKVEFWSLEKIDAGRSRKYDLVVIDEAAFGPPTTMVTWERAIKPTLTDRFGRALVVSNTKGVLPDNFFWRICNEPKWGFVCHQAKTEDNPTIPEAWGPEEEVRAVAALGEGASQQDKRDWLRHDELERLRKTEHPLVFAQEYEAKFVDWSGDAFFDIGKLLDDNGHGVSVPAKCDKVFAIMDTATKTGTKNDGTGVLYCAWFRKAPVRLVILDWHIQQIQGDLLEIECENIFQNLAMWANRCGAREGSSGLWIEDKSSGIVLVQALQRKRKAVQAIPSALTAVGKDERAIAVSGYIYRGEIKMTQEAYDKRVMYRNQELNHFVIQVSGYRVGIDGGPGSDDLVDCFSYGISIGLGDRTGY